MVQPSDARHQPDVPHLERQTSGWSKSAEDFENTDGNHPETLPAAESTIAFEALSTDGGQYSPEHSCQQLFMDETSCYSSKLSCNHGVNIVAKHTGLRNCTLDGISFRVPTAGYSCPVAQAIIFTSWDEPSLDGLQVFDNVQNKQEFDAASEAWCRKVALNRPMPVAFLDTRHSNKVSVSLKVPRSGKYVVVKLLRPRHPGDNVDAEFVGLHGWSGRRCFPCRLPVPL